MSYITLVRLYFNVSVEAALCAVPKPQARETPMLLKVAFEGVYTESLFKQAAAPYKRAYHINSDQNE